MPPRRGFFGGWQSIFYPNVAPLVLKMKPLRGDMFVKLIYIS